jgi:hypothetical protein
MLTVTECLIHAAAMEARAIDASGSCCGIFVLLADGWRITARMALWQDEWEKNSEIETM